MPNFASTFWFFAGLLFSFAQLAAQEVQELPLTAFLDAHCTKCHSSPDPDGGFDLEAFMDHEKDDLAAVKRFRVATRLMAAEMPPKGKTQPSAQAKKEFLAALEQRIQRDHALAKQDPGRVTLRRLSQLEYRNTIRDLFGVSCADLIVNFPADDLGYGFDNIGDASSFSLLHIEKYAEAAEQISDRVISMEIPGQPARKTYECEAMRMSREFHRGDIVGMFSNGRLSQKIRLPRQGHYEIEIRGWAQQAGPDLAAMRVKWDDEELKTFSVDGTREKLGSYKLKIEAAGGDHLLQLEFINDYYKATKKGEPRQDRNLYLDCAILVGPTDTLAPSAGETWIRSLAKAKSKPLKRIKKTLPPMLSRIWRRKVKTSEYKGITKLTKAAIADGANFAEVLKLAIAASLTSPNFLYRLEPGHLRAKDPAQDLSDEQLAVRMAYFLWSSTPDAELQKLAQKKALRDPAVRRAQITRMLADPRSLALAENFASQWLELRNIWDMMPDPELFAGIDRELRAAMQKETELLFDSVLREGQSAYRLLDAPYTFLNQRLADHYGVQGVEGPEFRRVALKDSRRFGVLGHAAFLTVTSNPNRTSPVKRGRWVLGNLLGASPPSPPDDVEALVEDEAIRESATLRERLALHREKPECATCHERMDVVGFALEGFDPVGRNRQGKFDNVGELPSGRQLKGVEGLRQYLAEDPSFLRVLAKKLFIYGIGRDLRAIDEASIDAMLKTLSGKETRLADLVAAIVELDAFRARSLKRNN